MNEKFAFMNCALDEKIYIAQSIGFVKHDKDRKVYKQHKT